MNRMPFDNIRRSLDSGLGADEGASGRRPAPFFKSPPV
jgi:hypothetical protein